MIFLNPVIFVFNVISILKNAMQFIIIKIKISIFLNLSEYSVLYIDKQLFKLQKI
jgi:hypothetical protein